MCGQVLSVNRRTDGKPAHFFFSVSDRTCKALARKMRGGPEKVVRASSSSQTQGESDSRAFFFCVLSVERCQLSKEEALGTVRRPCAMSENR